MLNKWEFQTELIKMNEMISITMIILKRSYYNASFNLIYNY